jgi:predicted dehydrogenase
MTDWGISIARADGSAEDLPVPERLRLTPATVPAGPAGNVALVYRDLARAIAGGQPAAPDFVAAVRHHQLLDAIQRASDTGLRQDVG